MDKMLHQSQHKILRYPLSGLVKVRVGRFFTLNTVLRTIVLVIYCTKCCKVALLGAILPFLLCGRGECHWFF